jgi:hypothetical protein
MVRITSAYSALLLVLLLTDNHDQHYDAACEHSQKSRPDRMRPKFVNALPILTRNTATGATVYV